MIFFFTRINIAHILSFIPMDKYMYKYDFFSNQQKFVYDIKKDGVCVSISRVVELVLTIHKKHVRMTDPNAWNKVQLLLTFSIVPVNLTNFHHQSAKNLMTNTICEFYILLNHFPLANI